MSTAQQTTRDAPQVRIWLVIRDWWSALWQPRCRWCGERIERGVTTCENPQCRASEEARWMAP
jgi:hypothetical protein